MQNISADSYQKYKRIMKNDNSVYDEITNLDDAKILLQMVANHFYLDMTAINHKYQWHNLRQNPDDLPQIGIDVLISVQWGYEKSWHDSNGWRNVSTNGAAYYRNEEVQAWTYIEPFKEK